MFLRFYNKRKSKRFFVLTNNVSVGEAKVSSTVQRYTLVNTKANVMWKMCRLLNIIDGVELSLRIFVDGFNMNFSWISHEFLLSCVSMLQTKIINIFNILAS